ncbi:MAG: class I SAM-dependent methyltransferase [bacterium]|nr:class I SAM-dependent methyltransferase [bacterium]
MVQQNCALCERSDFAVVYQENFDVQLLDEKIFSARRLPDRIHYRIVRCNRCGLIYSNPILEVEKINAWYRKSFVSYDAQVENLVRTYGHYLQQVARYHAEKERLLEIGCGNGFFLDEAQRQGYAEVYGVEPGEKSVEKAPPELRPHILVDVIRPGLFPNEYFDVICCFQTLDHLPDPNAVLASCRGLLKKNGVALFFNHNVGAWSAKLLGRASPIIDIEHTYLYDKRTMRALFEKHGFTVREVNSAFNIHNLSYWVRLFPLPKKMKLFLLRLLQRPGLDVRLKMYAGNLVLFAQK